MNTALNILGDPSFESGLPNPVWEGDSPMENPGEPNIIVAAPPLTRTGTHALHLVEIASAEQTITRIPVSHEALLTLHVWNVEIGASPEDVVHVFIDETVVASINNGDPDYTGGYTPVVVDFTEWADGLPHDLVISSDFKTVPFDTEFLIDDVTVTACPLSTDLSISMTDSLDPVRTGDTLVYTIEVSNSGPGAARDPVVVDTLPPELTVTGTEIGQGTAEVMGGVVTFELGGLSAPVELMANGSFETRDLTGWTAVQAPVVDEHFPAGVYPAGTNTGFFAPSSPADGTHSYLNGFDGDGPFTYDLSQEVTIPTSAVSAALSWVDELQWDLATFCGSCTGSREYEVTVEPAGGGPPLATLFREVVEAGTARSGSGEVSHSVDLLSLGSIAPGDTIRLNWRQFISEEFTGPGEFELDAVSLLATTPGATATMTIETQVGPTVFGSALFNTATVSTATPDRNLGNNTVVISTEVVAPDVAVFPSALNFGSLDIEEDPPVVRSLSVGSAGSETLLFLDPGIVISGPGSAELTIIADTGQTTLSPGASRELLVEFAPVTVGNKSSQLIITTNDPDEPTLVVPISAFAVQDGPTGRTTAEIVAYILGLLIGPMAEFDVNMDGRVDAADVVANIEATTDQ
jgi:uncharacterized repeat protein (TIGR01451 family)